MRRLSRRQRAQILHLLCEGMSQRAVARATDTALMTVAKLQMDAGEACMEHHDRTVRGVEAARVEADEIWSFTYAKESNVPRAKNAPPEAGDTYTWVAIDPDTKLVISWHVGRRDEINAYVFLTDLAERVAGRTQLTTDGLPAYANTVEAVFGADIDYSQLVKHFGAGIDLQDGERRYSPKRVRKTSRPYQTGAPDPRHITTSHVERQNLTMRMHMRRFTRLTNGFSKRIAQHVAGLAVYFTFYNFCRVHSAHRTTPAMAAGLTDTLLDLDWMVSLVEARDSKPGPRGPYRRRQRSAA